LVVKFWSSKLEYEPGIKSESLIEHPNIVDVDSQFPKEKKESSLGWKFYQ
jgi:hypothetical protein